MVGMADDVTWIRVAGAGELPEGRVVTVTAGDRSLALTHWQGRYGAFDNRCPHQGGPLGEGSIEKGWLRCPWHGYDYDPLTGTPPPGVQRRPDLRAGRGPGRRRLRRHRARAPARAHGRRRHGRDDG